MFPFSRKKRKVKNPTPPWMVWLLVAFVIYALLSKNSVKVGESTQSSQISGDVQAKLPTEEPSLGSIVDPKKIIDVDFLKGKLLPKRTMSLRVKDNALGDGNYSVCGQKVTVIYSSSTEEKKEIETDKKITFQIGSGEIMPALERGIVGMKKNGTRTISSPGDLAYGVEKFSRDDVPALANINFEVKMLDISPELPEIGAYRVIGDGFGRGKIYTCGSKTKLHLSIWDVEGKKLYDSKDNNGEPISFVIGKSDVFLGLEQGVLQMSEGMHRNLIIPPSFQKTLQGTAPTIDFPLPKNQTILVDVEAMP
jgi:FKBP-type peptidyl-prolyl cis-trans isomerase